MPPLELPATATLAEASALARSAEQAVMEGVTPGGERAPLRVNASALQSFDTSVLTPCGATWEAAQRLVGHPLDDAVRKIGLDTQFYCSANPAGWDPIYGKSPVHFAGKIHSKELAKAIDRALLVLEGQQP